MQSVKGFWQKWCKGHYFVCKEFSDLAKAYRKLGHIVKFRDYGFDYVSGIKKLWRRLWIFYPTGYEAPFISLEDAQVIIQKTSSSATLESRLAIFRKHFTKGTPITLLAMKGETRLIKGLQGKVTHVDDMCQIHVEWQNGSTLALDADIDKFLTGYKKNIKTNIVSSEV